MKCHTCPFGHLVSDRRHLQRMTPGSEQTGQGPYPDAVLTLGGDTAARYLAATRRVI